MGIVPQPCEREKTRFSAREEGGAALGQGGFGNRRRDHQPGAEVVGFVFKRLGLNLPGLGGLGFRVRFWESLNHVWKGSCCGYQDFSCVSAYRIVGFGVDP